MGIICPPLVEIGLTDLPVLQGHQDPECKCRDVSHQFLAGTCIDPKNLKLHICWHFFAIGGGSTVCASYLLAVHTSYIVGTIERKLIKKIRTLEKWLQYRPLPNSFPTNYILINSKVKVIYPEYWKHYILQLHVRIKANFFKVH